MFASSPSFADQSLTFTSLGDMYPVLPRGLAVLVHAFHTDQRVRDNVGETPEVSAHLLSETLPLREQFEEKYGVAFPAARQVLRYTLGHGMEDSSEPAAGSGVLYAPAVRLLYRMGYLDGLEGAEGQSSRPTDWVHRILELPWPATGPNFPGGLPRMLKRVLFPPLEGGLRHGGAEAQLEEEHQELIEEIDRRLLEALEESSVSHHQFLSLLDNELSVALEGYCKGLAPPAPRAGPEYIRGRLRELRSRRARQELLSHFSSSGTFLPPLDGAVMLQRLSGEIEQIDQGDTYRRIALLDQLQECQLLLSASGVLPSTAASLQDSGLSGSSARAPEEILGKGGRDFKLASAARTLLGQLSCPPRHGRLWPLSLEGLPGSEIEEASSSHQGRPLSVLAGPLSLSQLERKVDQLARYLFADGDVVSPSSGSDGQLQQLKRTTRRARRIISLLEQEGAGLSSSLVSRLLWTRLKDCLPHLPEDSTSQQMARCKRLDELATLPPSPTSADYFRHQFWSGFRARASRQLLQQVQPSAYKLVQAESEIAQGGSLEQAEQAEQWVRTYQQEARLESQARPQALLQARRHVLEHSLSQRSCQEAQYQLGRYVPHLDQETYLCPELVKRLARGGMRVLRLSRNFVERSLSDTPRFQQRTLKHLEVELVDWILRELYLAHQMRAHT